jgi:hypothetical protein
VGFGGTTRQRQGRFAYFHQFVRFRFGNIESFQTVSLFTWVNGAASRKFDPRLGGTCLLRVLRLGDGAQLLHQSEQVKLDQVLLHLAVYHAVEPFDSSAGTTCRASHGSAAATSPCATPRISSPSGGRTLQGKEGDVVLLLPLLSGETPQLLHQGGAQAPPTLQAFAQEVPKARGSEHLALGVMRLY